MFQRSIAILLDVAILALVAAVVLTAAIGPLAALSGRRALAIGGGSMSPTIPVGSMVIVEPAGDRSIREGEVTTFRTLEGIAVTHRVIRIVERADGAWYETKGDANASPDPALWPASAVVGRVVAFAPVLGYSSWLFRHPIGWLNVAVLAAWLLFARRLAGRSSDHGPRSTQGQTGGSIDPGSVPGGAAG